MNDNLESKFIVKIKIIRVIRFNFCICFSFSFICIIVSYHYFIQLSG